MMYVHYEQAVEAMTKGMSQVFIAIHPAAVVDMKAVQAQMEGTIEFLHSLPPMAGSRGVHAPARALTERARKTAKTAFPSPRRRGRGFCRPKKRMCKKLRLNSDENRRYD